MSRLAIGIGVVLLLGQGAVVWAETPAPPVETDNHKAKVLFENGMKQYNLGSFKEALVAFKEAYLLKSDPVFLFNIGQCHRMMGSSSDAAYAYRRYLGASPSAPNKADVERFIAMAEEEIKRKAAAEPPTGVIRPKDTATTPTGEPPAVVEKKAVVVEPVAAIVTAPPTVAESAPVYRRWYVWTIFVAIVAAGAAVGIGVAAAPRSVTVPASDLGPMTLMFR